MRLKTSYFYFRNIVFDNAFLLELFLIIVALIFILSLFKFGG